MRLEDEPALSLESAKIIVAGKTAPKVTEQSIMDRIGAVTYHHVDQLTICTITMVNGFHVIGHSAPASPANYDAEVGKRYAFDNAFKHLWQLEGYLLRERLHQEEIARIAAEIAAKPTGGVDASPTAV